MKEKHVKQILKKAVALTMALLIALSATWTGLSTVSFATDGTEAEAVDAGDVAPTDDNEIEIGVPKTVKVEGNIVYLKFTPVYSGEYRFYSKASVDPVGYLFDTNKNQLAYSDDDGGNRDFSITYNLEAGTTYYWGAGYYEEGNFGSFNVTLLCLDCPHDSTKSYVEAKAATCTEDGHSAGERCDICKSWFSEVEIYPATHVESNGKILPAVEATCTSYGYTEGVWCDECNKWISEREKIVVSHKDENSDGSCDLCSKTMQFTSNSNGDIRYYFYPDGTLEFYGEGQLYTGGFGYDASAVKSIIIHEGITTVGDNAFSGYDDLISVTVPSSVTEIGDYAFSGCTSIDSVVISKGVTTIGEQAFYNCISLESIIIPEGVTTIYRGAFRNCTSLKSVTIPEGVITIADSTFNNCTSLESVTVPSTVTYMGSDAFYNCESLKKVYAADAASWVNISYDNRYSAPLSYATELYFDNKLATDVVIPKGATKIGSYAFYNCISLESIIIPEGVTLIGLEAFYNCASLESVAIPGSVTSIGGYAFKNCTSLKSITIPEGVTEIEYYAFNGCKSLESITLPSTLACVGNGAFDGCVNLKKVYAADIKSWLNIEFSEYGCSTPMSYATELYFDNQLVTDVAIPESVTAISRYAFYNCRSLKSVVIPEGVATIGEYAFCNCKSLKNITIPEGVTSIGTDAFYNCTSLESVTISEGVTSIGYSAFGGCTSLESIVIPDSVTLIDDYAFNDCYKLSDVTLGSKLKTIGYYAFDECDLTRITVPESVISIENYAFESNVVIYCKKGSVAAAWAEDNDNPYVLTDGTDEESLFSGKCGSGVTYTFDKRTGVLEIKGSGAITSFSQAKAPWYDNRYSVREIIIPQTITAIGNYAFENCYNLDSVIIPDSVTTIGNCAFYNCYSLKSITLGNGVTYIGENAFCYCEKLGKVYASDIASWLNIEFEYEDSSPLCNTAELYFGGELVTDVVIPEGITEIKHYAFLGCSSLESVVISDGATSVADYAFYYCENLKSVVIPDSVVDLGQYAFAYCTKLNSVSLSKKLQYISYRTFYNCKALEKITIPYGVKNIYSGAFSGCKALTEIVVFNPECVFDTECGFNLNQTIYGVPGSTAEAFAFEIGADFYDLALVHTHQFVAQEVRGYCSYKLCSCGTPELVLHTDANYDAVCDSCSKSVNDIDVDETRTFYMLGFKYHYLAFTATKEGDYGLSAEGDYDDFDLYYYDEDMSSRSHYSYYDNGIRYVRLNAGDKIYWCVRPYYTNDTGRDIKLTVSYKQNHTCSYETCTSEITKQPTCTTNGTIVYTCTCGETYTETLYAGGHSYGAWYISKAASCTDGTVIKRDCKNCTVSDTISLGGSGDHTVETIVSRATDTHSGKVIKSCSVCGEKISTTTVAKIASVTLSDTKYTYNGKAKTPTVTVKDSKGKTLNKDTDYTVTYSSSSRKSIGKYTVTVKFDGNYGGTEKLSFTIVPAEATGLKASADTTSSVKLSWKAVSGATNYRVYKYDSSKKKYVSVAFVSGTSYSVSSLKAATTYKFKVRAYTELSDDSFLCGGLSSEVSATTKLAAPSISKITSSSKGSVTVKWSNVSGESGYQLYYATSKNGTYKSAASFKADKTTGSKSKLTSKKTYYFKVRAYKTVGKTTIYSAWSSVKSVKVK